VGKTTTSAAIGTGLALRGHKTVIVDFDVGLRNLDLIMGCERRVVYDFVNVVNGEANLQQALIKDKRLENLYVLAASQTRDKDALTKEGVEKVLMELKEQFEFVVCDSPAGIEKGAHLAMYFADEAIVVTNPEVSSVRDSDRMLGLLASKSRRAEQGDDPIKEHLLITRYHPERVEKAKCWASKTSRKSSRSTCWASFPNPRRCSRRPTRASRSSSTTRAMPARRTVTPSIACWASPSLRFIDVPKKDSSHACLEASKP
jgi:septum site-determining protein MinD